MNAEYLLDAIGQLDDELVREAERYRRPKARYGRLMGLAACFAVAVALGYVLTHFGMGGGAAPSFSGGGNGGGAPASGNSAPSTSDGADTPHEPEQPLGSSSPSGENAGAPGVSGDSMEPVPNGEPFWISMRLDGNLSINSFFFEPRVLDELPEGCVELGKLEFWGGTKEPNVPYTASEEYVGCPIWLLMEGPETFTFYVGLPDGGYLTNG